MGLSSSLVNRSGSWFRLCLINRYDIEVIKGALVFKAFWNLRWGWNRCLQIDFMDNNMSMIKEFRRQWSYTVWRLLVNLRMSSPSFSSFTWCVIWTGLRSMGSFIGRWSRIGRRLQHGLMTAKRLLCHKASNLAVRIYYCKMIQEVFSY